MGTKKLIFIPMGTKVPKWGPTWEQCIMFLLMLEQLQLKIWSTALLTLYCIL